MSEELEFAVGEVEGSFPEKYIVVDEGEGDLVYYSASLSRIEYIGRVASEQGYYWAQVIGSGTTFRDSEEYGLEMGNLAGDGLAVPEEILVEFVPGLKEAYDELGLEVGEVEIQTSGPREEIRESRWGRYLEKLE